MIVSVTQLNNYLKATIDTDEILQNITVKGELTNLKNSHGYFYFTLKDQCGHVDCFSYLADSGQFQQGAEVEASGSIRYLEKTGRISFFVKQMKLCCKEGSQYLKFLQLKEKLKKQGVFDTAHKRPLPRICRTVGVITSKDGAVIKDIQEVIKRRQPFSDILLYPVHVQGANAENEILTAIDYFSNSKVDVVIIARGGGSSEDLSVFNCESIVLAIFNCKVPTVSAVGHGVDFTLSDYSADVRAVTPSEAAELVTIDAPSLCQRITERLYTSQKKLYDKFQFFKYQVFFCVRDFSATVESKISAKRMFALKYCNDICLKVSNMHYKLQRDTENLLDRINLSNPLNVLRRGYASVSSDGQKIKHINQLTIGQKIELTFDDGKASATVEKLIPHVDD